MRDGAHTLATRARFNPQELSHDDSRDSPFAVLAKDNDIMWSGGRPDDITVIAARIVELGGSCREPENFVAYSGPGEPPAELAPLLAALKTKATEVRRDDDDEAVEA